MLARLAAMALAAIPAFAVPVLASDLDSSAGRLRISPVVTGLDEPWGMAFLPDESVLITERGGRLLRAQDGALAEVAGGPAVYAQGQGGLLDVMVPRDFATSREVWLSYATPIGAGAATAVGKGVLSDDGTRIDGFTRLYAGDEMPGGRHFGSRLVEAADGTVFVTTGDRGTGPDGAQAQDPGRAEGKVIHLNRDGTPATTLPGARPGVFSIGHRNAQGASLGPDGALWLLEHGAQGGDEVNRVEAGRNYGWPVISYGINYNGDAIGQGQAKDGMEQPLHYWDPSIAPSGMLFYDGGLLPDWQGDLFTGSLNSNFISRLEVDNGFAEERITAPETGRVRDVAQGPDGAIWFLSVLDGALYRMGPIQ
ncbi:MAG: PQQ-dependent sugar dehydrogenase [Pseudomonadota bacterium]